MGSLPTLSSQNSNNLLKLIRRVPQVSLGLWLMNPRVAFAELEDLSSSDESTSMVTQAATEGAKAVTSVSGRMFNGKPYVTAAELYPPD